MIQKPLVFLVFMALSPLILCAESPKTSPKPSNYVVQKGDCLWNISKQIWKNPLKWPLIYAANQDRIKNPNLIYPGQKFALPDIGSMTKVDLKEATRLAYSKMKPIPYTMTDRRASAILRDRAAPISKPELTTKEMAANTGQRPEENPGLSAPSEQKITPEAAPLRDSSWVKPFLLVAFLAVALISILFMMRKRGPRTSPQIQQPRSVSAFSGFSTPQPQASSPATPTQPPSQPAATPPPPKETQPPMHSGTITSVSMPVPSQPEAKPVPTTPPAASPPATAPEGLQAAPPVSSPPKSTSENEPKRPPDNNPPASSSNHAA